MYSSRLRNALAIVIPIVWWLAAAPQALAGPIEDHYALAAGHCQQQRYPEAVKEFRAFLKDHGDHSLAANAQFFLAESFLQQGDYPQASLEFTRFVENHPEHRYAAQAGFRLGETAYFLGKYDVARAKLAAFVAVHSRDKLCAFALPYLGDSELELGDYKAAQRAYEQALKSFPAGPLSAECRLGLGRAAEELGQPAEARRFYQFLAERDDLASASEAKLRLGRLYYRQQEFTDASEYLKPLASSTQASTQRTAARYWLGMVYQQQRDTASACELWKQALADDAEHALVPEIHMAWGDSLNAAGEYAAAQQQYEAITLRWPEHELADDALAAQALVALQLNQLDQVPSLANKFQQVFPQSPLLVHVEQLQGRGLLRQRKFVEAEVVFARLASVKSPEQAEYQYALCLAQLGATKYDSVLSTVGSINRQQLKPELAAGILATEATALVSLKRPDEALPLLEKYLAQYPQGGDAAKCRAQECVALAQLGKYEEAKRSWQHYVEQHAEHAALLPTTLFLAESAQRSQKSDQAREWFTWLADQDRPESYRRKGNAGLAALDHQPELVAKSREVSTISKPIPAESNAGAAAAFAKAQHYEKLGEPDNALAAYLDFIAKHPQASVLPDALLAAARLHDERHQDREADVLLAKLVAEYPQYAQLDVALYQRAWVLMDLQRDLDATQHLSRIHSDYRESRFWADATYRLAELKLRAQQFETTNQLLDDLLKQPSTDELRAHALYLQGQVAVAQQQWPNVQKPLLALVEAYPKSELKLLAEYWLAEADYRQGKWREAGERLADLSTRIEGVKEPWVAMVPLRQAQVLAHLKRWSEAEAVASTIAQKYPDFRQQHEADYLLGRSLQAQAKFDGAREAYERVVRSPSGGRTETAAMAQWMIGESYFQQEKYDDAVKAYHRVERLFEFPKWQATALLQAGKCHETQGHWREAIGLYAQVLKEHPQEKMAAEASQRLRVAQQRAATAGTRIE